MYNVLSIVDEKISTTKALYRQNRDYIIFLLTISMFDLGYAMQKVTSYNRVISV